VIAIEQLSFAIAPVLGGVVLLLLLGTQILDWYWLALLGMVGAVIATVRMRNRKLSRYQTAQVLDRRLQLVDSLSTAWFLLEHKSGECSGVVEFQLKQAEEVAAAVDPIRAFPLTWQRTWTATGALAMVAISLFAARYLVTRTLSLQQSLIPVQMLPVIERVNTHSSGMTKFPGDSGALTRRMEQRAQLPNQTLKDTPQALGQQSGAESNSNDQSGSKTNNGSGTNPNAQDADRQSRAASSGNSEANGKQSDQLAGTQDPTKNADGKHQSNGGQESSSGLMDKMRDALSSFLAKMRQSSSQTGQQNSRPSDEDKAASQSSGNAQQRQQDAQNQQSGQDQGSEGQSQAQASERTQAAQGRSSDSMPEKSADAHSGIGQQDGDKALKEAEQLQAMGKLAEIIGKRSASLTGDMTVETPSGKQELKTAYSRKLGHHSDAGGEINRDEIPLADQQYVRQYMELVRKQGKTANSARP
jgi:hypothetical protein